MQISAKWIFQKQKNTWFLRYVSAAHKQVGSLMKVTHQRTQL